MSHSLVFFTLLVLGLWLLLTVMFVYVIVQKIKENRWRKEVEAYRSLYQPILLRYLTEGEHVPPPLVSAQHVAMMELLDHFIRVLDDKVKERAVFFGGTIFFSLFARTAASPPIRQTNERPLLH